MQAILLIFICFTGMLVLSLWAIGLFLAYRSRRGFSGLFSQRSQPHWLSIPDTIAQYGEGDSFTPD